jgi:small subunit ribosomal protein S4
MGDPKKQRKKYRSPKFLWSKSTLNAELRLLGRYGLRNKRELYRHRFTLSKYRALARGLLAKPPEERVVLEKPILNKLAAVKFVTEDADLDDILDLSIDNILERRLQTVVYNQGLSKSLQQARQLIVHGHIAVKGKRVTTPSYIVKTDEEQEIRCTIPLSTE